MQGTSLRDRKRLDAMKRVQTAAVDAFARKGFDQVTVEQIAEDAMVAPISVYRWFGTKENIVLWDEYDPPLYEAIAERLAEAEPLVAVRDGLTAELDKMYDAERALVLRRTRLIMNEPALLAAASRNQRELLDGLATLFDQAASGAGSFKHRILASVAVGVLTAALEEWTTLEGSVPLRELIGGAFEEVRRAQWDT